MNKNILKRYLDVSALLYLLKRRAVTLLDPRTWVDSNDSHGLLQYKKAKKLKTLLALCFTEAPETFHHWHVFAHGISGACITFRKTDFVSAISGAPSIRHELVEYIKLDDYRHHRPTIDKLPFIKRYGFQDEKEYRIIYEDKKNAVFYKDIRIPLTSIERITLSPWIPDSLYEALKEIIKDIEGCSDIKVIKSRLINSTEWMKLTSNYIC